jgi:hypothetical protein
LRDKYLVDSPVYFSERSVFYEMFDEIVIILQMSRPSFNPSPEQRYFTVELLVMGRDLVLLKVILFFNNLCFIKLFKKIE